jgi:hypothetical protein
MEEFTMTDQNAKQWQAMFQPISMFMGASQKNAHTFWDMQAEFLNGMQTFAEGWFQRRHIGTQAAQEACERMCQAKTPIEWFHEYQTWSTGAFQRLMADGFVLQKGLKKIADEVSPSLAPSQKEQSETVPTATKSRARAEA